MKRRRFVALTVAGALACSSTFAFSGWNSFEVRTPSQVDESAPWLANKPHTPAHMSQSFAAADSYSSSSFGTGASSSRSGSGSAGYHSGHMSYGTDASGHGFSGSHSNFGSTSGFGASGMGGYTTSPMYPQPLSD